MAFSTTFSSPAAMAAPMSVSKLLISLVSLAWSSCVGVRPLGLLDVQECVPREALDF